MRRRVGASVASVRPVQEDGGRGPVHESILDRQVLTIRDGCCRGTAMRIVVYARQRPSRSLL